MQHVALINGLMIAPLVVGIVLYKIKADTGFVKDVFSVGYGLFYFIVLITESDVMHFVYVIPMLCLTSIFHNWKYTLRTSIGVVVIIIVFSIKALTSGSLNIALNSGVVSVTPVGLVVPSASREVGAVGFSFPTSSVPIEAEREDSLVNIGTVTYEGKLDTEAEVPEKV